MKKIACLFLATLLMGSGAVMAQGELDALKLSQTDVNGTARYLGMGGAFGALGGDISAMSSNPAGLGIYRSSEMVITFGPNIMNSKSQFNGTDADGNKTNFSLDNFGYVGYFPTGNTEGLVGWQVGFSYNRLKNFHRQYRMTGRQSTSLAEYIADISYGISEGNLEGEKRYNNGDWLSVLGWNAYLFSGIPSTNPQEYAADFTNPDGSDLQVRERGGIDQYNFSFATNISNTVFLGATFAVTDMRYRMESYYDESFGAKDYLYLDNALSTDGTGYAFNLGAIVRATDYLRLGVAYNSPTWYNMTDYFYGEAGSYVDGVDTEELSDNTPNNQYNEYNFRAPDKWIFSVAGIIGQSALVSVDYEFTNYKNARLKDDFGDYTDVTYAAKNFFKNTHLIKLGAEVKVTPQFALRAGGYWKSPNVTDRYRNGYEEVLVAGTIPHYTVDKGTGSFSFGLGYRFTPNFYADVAYVYRQHSEKVYAFPNVYAEFDDDTYRQTVSSDAATMKTKTNKIAFTLGYKF